MPVDRLRPGAPRIIPILLVALATLLVLAMLSEGTARYLFRSSPTTTMTCLIAIDAHTGVRGVPNSSCRQKIFESPLVRYDFNDCGFRTPQPCRPAPAGTYRIVLIGSSFAYGMHVAQPLSFAGRLGPMLSDRTGRPIDIFDEGMQWGTVASLALRTDAMLRPRPDMILWTLTPFDMENIRLILPYIPGVQDELSLPSPAEGKALPPPPESHGPLSLPGRAWRRLIRDLSASRTIFMLQHYLYRSQSQYLAHTLGPDGVDYLRVPSSRKLQDNLAFFADRLGLIAARARATGVPLVVTLLPSRAQAIMLTNRMKTKDYDPDQLGRLLRPIVEAKGARYIDAMSGIEKMPDAGQLYFTVDGHLPPEGHQMLANLLADALVRSNSLPTRQEGAR